MNRLYLFAWLVFAILSACTAPLTYEPSPTPTCFPRGEATGEKYIGPTVVATPPSRIQPGQTLVFEFSGHYLIGNYSIICAGTVTGYTHGDNLPGFTWAERRVQVQLDDRVLVTSKCAYNCRVDVPIPSDLAPGTHTLTVLAPWQALTFRVQADATNRAPPPTPR